MRVPFEVGIGLLKCMPWRRALSFENSKLEVDGVAGGEEGRLRLGVVGRIFAKFLAELDRL